MDCVEEKDETEVSLPGAGGTEPTILEVLNREPETKAVDRQILQLEKADLKIEQVNLTIDTETNQGGPINIITDNSLEVETNDNSPKILELDSCFIEEIRSASSSEQDIPKRHPIEDIQVLSDVILADTVYTKPSQLKSAGCENDLIQKEIKTKELSADFLNELEIIVDNVIANAVSQISTSSQKDESLENESEVGLAVESKQKRNTFGETGSKDKAKTDATAKQKVKFEPTINNGTVPTDPSFEAKRAYYQKLREYLNHQADNRPPVPLQTYKWEDLKRAKQQGGYPWTHLYKRPLGPNEEPEIIQAHRSQQHLFRHRTDSPRSLKRVHYHEEVLVKETERYINDLSDTEDNAEEDEDELAEEADSHSVQSEPTYVTEAHIQRKKLKGPNRLRKFFSRSRPSVPKINITLAKDKSKEEFGQPKSEDSPKNPKCCHTVMDKLKLMADKQFKKRNIRKIPLKDKENIVLADEQKILKLKISPKADRSEIPHFVEKQDSDEILEIVHLQESPSNIRKRRDHPDSDSAGFSSILIPDEIIEISKTSDDTKSLEDISQPTPEPTISEILEEELKTPSPPPPKAPRKKKEHIYEDIDEPETVVNNIEKSEELQIKIDEIIEEAIVGALKKSLAAQDKAIAEELKSDERTKHLDELGSSEEDQQRPRMTHLAPISSIDSASSEEDRRTLLPALSEESDQGGQDEKHHETVTLKILEKGEHEMPLSAEVLELKPSLRREPSPSPSADKKVTFSHVEDEADPHREDVPLPDDFTPPNKKWSKMSDHEYEPIGEPQDAQSKSDALSEGAVREEEFHFAQIDQKRRASDSSLSAQERKQPRLTEEEVDESNRDDSVQEMQRNIEERYFSSATTTPRTDSRTDTYIRTSQVDSSAIEELPLKAESRKKSFIASAQDRSKKVQENLRTQAGKIKSKLSSTKKPASSSPKTKERKRFKAPEFSKMKMPTIKRPEMPKLKAPDMSRFKRPDFSKIDIKRPEFTKISKPDMSKFKIPDRFSSLRIGRSKSLKEPEDLDVESGTTPESGVSAKKRFEFNFGTYPRALRKKREKLSTQVIAKADDGTLSTETPKSIESIPTVADGEKGPVRSRWADKFSDVSGDSESGNYKRYGSEQGLERESSLERQMRDELERSAREDAEIGMLDQKQYADYDEENRAIHEISKFRAGEFKQRKPMVHQDSAVSEESKELGWSERDIRRNKILARNDLEESYQQDNFASDERLTGSASITNQETQSTGSSSALRHKGVIEEIDDDEFFLRKRGISQDNIEIREYISSAIREGLGTESNALAKLGSSQEYYSNELDVSNDRMQYNYDVPPPKPRRVKHFNISNQSFEIDRKGEYDDNVSLPQEDNEFFNHMRPSRPLRKSKKQYSDESQDQYVPPEDVPYFDDETADEERPFYQLEMERYPEIARTYFEDREEKTQFTRPSEAPKAPKRRRKQTHDSVDKDEYLTGFAGRSISNSYLQDEENQLEEEKDVAVYRTEHKYTIPLATIESFATTIPTPPRRSRSRSQVSKVTDDDRTSRGADSIVSDAVALSDQKEVLERSFKLEMNENEGYAIIRKDPPPRPPAPVRRKKSTNSADRRFQTLPVVKDKVKSPEKIERGYNTIGPSRPPRRKSGNREETQLRRKTSSPDVTQYEELDIDFIDELRPESPRNLNSGDVINKMKYRPLPPPPRPPREHKKHKGDDENDQDFKDDRDGGGETTHLDGTASPIEVEASTQTDPLPDDFVYEEFDITDDMKVIEPTVSPRTLAELLKEMEENEAERLRRLAEDDTISKGLQRFRDSNRRSLSEKSRASSGTRSRASTPSAIVIEKRVPTPIPYLNTVGIDASIIIQPIDDDEFADEDELELQIEHEAKHLSRYSEEKPINVDPSRKILVVPTQEQRLIEQPEHHQQEHFPLQSELVGKVESEDEDLESEIDLPPNPPPRKRSSIPTVDDTPAKPEKLNQGDTQSETSLVPLQEIVDTTISPELSLPTRLTLSELQVDNLSVNALQAGRIMDSQLQGSSISTDQLECKNGNLVVNNIEFPPGFVDQIVERVRNSQRDHIQAEAQTPEISDAQNQTEQQNAQNLQQGPKIVSTSPQDAAPPARPPPPNTAMFPSEYMQFSTPPPSFFQLRNPIDDEYLQSAHRRRRHHRRRDSSSDEEQQRSEHRRSRQSNRSPEPTVGQLGGQLLNACGSSVFRTMNQIVNMLRGGEKQGTERPISTAVVILILVTLGFLLLGLSGRNIHHHHWDYFNPPGNQGRG